MPIERRWRLIILVFGVVALATASSAQTSVALGKGSATVAFPRGEPALAQPPDEASIASTLQGIDKQLEDVGRADKKPFWNAYFRAQLSAKTWVAVDLATGQTFVASGYELPAADTFEPLSCDGWIKVHPKPKRERTLECTDVSIVGGQALELKATTENGVREVGREYMISGRRYSLSYSSSGSQTAKLTGLRYIRADDSAKFFASFKFLGSDHGAVPSPGG